MNTLLVKCPNGQCTDDGVTQDDCEANELCQESEQCISRYRRDDVTIIL